MNPRHKQFCSEYYVWFCRLWGISTALVLWGIGVEVTFNHELVGCYIIVAAVIVSALESIFLIHYVIQEHQSDCSQSCLSCWSYAILIDDWKKSILYVLLSIFCLIRHFILAGEAWLSAIAGIMLLLAAFFYSLKSCTRSRLFLQESANGQQSQGNAYRRVNRSGEELGSAGSITNDIPSHMADSISIQSGAALLSNAQERSMAEQVEIMEA